MYNVYFSYSDKNDVLCQNINRIEVETSSGYTSITGEQLLTHHFRIHGTIHLYSDIDNYSVTTSGLLYIKVYKN